MGLLLRSPRSLRSSTLNVGLLLTLLVVLLLCGLQYLLAGSLPTLQPPGLHPSRLSSSLHSQPPPYQSSVDESVSLQLVLLHLTAAEAKATVLPEASPSPVDMSIIDIAACRPDDTVIWEKWRSCVEQVLARASSSSAPSFYAFIKSEALRLPWSVEAATDGTGTAVLLEFRAMPQQLRFTVNNAIDNLPVQWPVQVVGGAAICRLAKRLYPHEVAAGKVVTTDLGIGDVMRQDLISAILTDQDLFYSKLLGDTWLFIQYDSAICLPQRDRLAEFLKAGYGWWGAPWAHWHRWPAFGGNGGFSLRRRAFITAILSTFRWVDKTISGNEDWWFCQRAADVYPWLLARRDRRIIPAPREEALAFSVEMLYHERPFGVHQIWTSLNPPNATALSTLLHNCPEALHILPGDILSRRPDWRGVLCDLRPSLAGCAGSSSHAAVVNKYARAKGQQLLGRRRREAKQRKQHRPI